MRERFGPYLLLDRIASGGMAEVWRAKQGGALGFSRIVAVKRILDPAIDDEDFQTMFRDEALITVRLQHANIGQVYEFGRAGKVPWLAMEYCSGLDLKKLWSHFAATDAPLPPRAAAHVVRQVASGLDYAHKKRGNLGEALDIVHRDVSPQNVMLTWDGQVKLVDFGIARCRDKAGDTDEGVLKGKLAYMAPEQAWGRAVDARADVFALGVVFWELLTGTRAFVADHPLAVLEKVRHVELPPPSDVVPDVDPTLQALCVRCLAPRPDDRFARAQHLADALSRWLHDDARWFDDEALGTLLTTTFPGDFDRERLRLESYRTIAVPDDSGARADPAARAPDPEVRAHDAGAGRFSSQYVVPTDTLADALPVEAGPRTRTTGIRDENPLARAAPPAPTTRRGSAPLVAVAAAGVLLGLIALAAALLVALLASREPTRLVLTVDDEAATVLVDGVPRGAAAPTLSIDVKPGRHVVTVRAPGMRPEVRKVVVPPHEVLRLALRLAPAPRRVAVQSTPPGARIVVDDVDTGRRTPAHVDLAPGLRHALRLEKDGYLPETVRIFADDDTAVIDRALRTRAVPVAVTSSPAGARVRVDGRALPARTPTSFSAVRGAPPPIVEVRRRGCATWRSSVPLDDAAAREQVHARLRCRR